MRTAEDSVLQLALENGLLTPAQLAAARAYGSDGAGSVEQQDGVLDVLIRHGALEAGRLAGLLAEKHGLPVVNLRALNVSPVALATLPPEWAERHNVLPYAREGTTLRVAVSNPFDFAIIDGIGHLTRLVVEPAVAPAEEIRRAIRDHYGRETGGAVAEASCRREAFAPKEDGDEAPVIRLVQTLVRQAVERRASDIHFEPMARRFRVRYRIDGILQEAPDPPRALQRAVISRLKIMANMSIAEKRLPQDGRARCGLEGRTLDLRVSSLPTVHGESIVMRLLEQEKPRLGLAELGLHPDDQKTLERMLALPDGIVLVTGPTGSGKTTTLYACLHHLNQSDRKLITVEDPVEYQLAGVNQVPVRGDVGLTFAAALRAMLRQAPNVIMVGEIRDRETAEIAMHAALTGHLVFSTLHTNDAVGAITRLVDLGVRPFLVASALRAVVAQRLVRRVCPHCAAQPSGTPAAPRCAACSGTGYRGRVGIFELLAVDEELQRLIHENAGLARLRLQVRAGGMSTLRQDGLRKARAGLTTTAEVLASTIADAN